MKFIKLLSLILIGLFSSQAFASGWNTLVVDVRDDEPFVIALSETLSVRVDDGALVVSDLQTSFEIPLGEIVSVTHRKTPHNISTSVSGLQSEPSRPSIALSSDEIILKGFPSGSRCIVCDMSGMIVLDKSFGDEYVIPLSLFGRGVFVVSAGDVSLKFTSR